jgi:hypothetical protein
MVDAAVLRISDLPLGGGERRVEVSWQHGPIRSVASRLARGGGADMEGLDLDVLRPPTFARLEKVLHEAAAAGRPYDVVHFDGTAPTSTSKISRTSGTVTMPRATGPAAAAVRPAAGAYRCRRCATGSRWSARYAPGSTVT